MNEKSFRDEYEYKLPSTLSVCNQVHKIKKRRLKSLLLKAFPILAWLPSYKPQNMFLADFVSGLTQGIMKVSQGLAYAQLTGQHPVYGLYSCLFPPLFYTLFASSRHLSFGVTATADMIYGPLMEELAPSPNDSYANATASNLLWKNVHDERIAYASMIALLNGIFLFSFSLFRLGFLAKLLSKPVQNGFIFAAVCILYVSQVKNMLGIFSPRISGTFGNFKNIYQIGIKLANLTAKEQTKLLFTSLTSFFSLTWLIFFSFINKKYKTKMPMNIPLPGEIMLLVVATLISGYTDLHNIVDVIGNLPQGFPTVTPPDFSRAGAVLIESASVSVVGMSLVLSLTLHFSEKGNYPVDTSQEISAVGLANIIGSFFKCLPSFGSMSRTSVQFESGGKTQLVGWVASLVIVVTLFTGSLLANTPKACLSAIVCVAVLDLLTKIKDVKTLWKAQKLDAISWLITCFATLCFEISYGLLIGIVANFALAVVRIWLVKVVELKKVGKDGVYKERSYYEKVAYIDERVLVVSCRAPINFLNASSIFSQLHKLWRGQNGTEEKKRSNSTEMINLDSAMGNGICTSNHTVSLSNGTAALDNLVVSCCQRESIVIDCSSVLYVDSVGVAETNKIINDFKRENVDVYLACCSERFLDAFLADGHDYIISIAYVSIGDAVKHALKPVETSSASLELHED